MADEALEPTEALELTEEVEQVPDGQAAPEPQDDPEEEEILTFGDAPEEVAETDNAVIRHLREELKKARKDAVAASRPKAEEAASDPGPRPTLEQYDYDEDRHADAIVKWAKETVQSEVKASKSTEAQQEELEATRKRIAAEKQALNRPNVEEAFELVRATLTNEQQSALVRATEKGGMTAKMVYALAQSPETLASLASAADLFDFAVELGTLRKELKVVKRRKAPDPDVPEKGSGKIAFTPSAAQKQLDKMEADWKGGDRSHIQKFKREHGLK